MVTGIKILNPIDQRKFLELPETGMGYQLAKVFYKIGEYEYKGNKFEESYFKENFLILNATIMLHILNHDDFENTLKSLQETDIQKINKENFYTSGIIDKVELIQGQELDDIVSKFTKERKEYPNKRAKDSEIELTSHFECFIRFSSFADDKRIDFVNRRVLPGTYATTCQDAAYCVNNRIDPIARYALPNTARISYYFRILPEHGTPIQRGIVQPAFGQPGGGVEVLFPHGTTVNTTSGPYIL